jgi:type II secretory pathway component GspD/PulD (secretin)
MRLTLCRLFAAAVFAAAPVSAHAAAPAPAAAKNANPMDAARKALDEVGDMNYQNKTLNEVIGDLKDKAKLAVIIDPMVYQFGLDPNQPTVSVNIKGVKLKDGLRQALAPFGLKCGLTKDGLFISTEEGLTTKQLRQRVSVDCDGTAFAATVKSLAADTGANVVLDPRLKEKGNAAVTLKLDDVPLETAVRLLAEVADLGVVRMSNVLFVTTPERAEKLRTSADAPTQPNGGVVPFLNGIPGGPGGGPPVIGLPGIGIAPAPAPAPPAQKAEEKNEPEKK